MCRFLRSPFCPTGLVLILATNCLFAEDQVAILLQQLGSDDFIQRQRATETLCALGLDVAEPVARLTQDGDPEVRLRAREILRTIRHDDRERIVQAFVAGREVAALEQLPGWRQFQEIAGVSQATRDFYAEILRDEWLFLDLVYQAEPATIPGLLAQRYESLDQIPLQSGKRITVSSLGALVLAMARDNGQATINPTSVMLLGYKTHGFESAVAQGPHSEPLRRLLGYLVRLPTPDSHLNQTFHFALTYDLQEAVAMAGDVLGERRGSPYVRQYALLLVGKLGADRDLAWVANALDDDSIVTTHNRIRGRHVTTKVCDVALAVLIARQEKDFTRYGLTDVQRHRTQFLRSTSIGFATDSERQAAIDRWNFEQTPPSSTQVAVEGVADQPVDRSR